MTDTPTTDPVLLALLKASATHSMTPREIWQQRVSFVYGQMMDCAPELTREDIERKAEEVYGPCPK